MMTATLPAPELQPGLRVPPVIGPATSPMRLITNQEMAARDRAKAVENQQKPAIQDLAAYVRGCWSQARIAKEQDIEPRMWRSLRQRRGEYEPDILADIKAQGGSEIYMMLSSVKCRAAASWLRDALLGNGNNKPWTLTSSPVPDLPPDVIESLMQTAQQQLTEMMQMGIYPTDGQVREALLAMKEAALRAIRDAAEQRMELMEQKMEDQLLEGGFHEALSQFIDDLTTFPAAILKGPVVRKLPRMAWKQGADGQWVCDVQEKLVLTWERVDPTKIYPSKTSAGVNDGYLIERHQLSRSALYSLIGVEGYDEASIRAVLDEYGRGGLREWVFADSEKMAAEGRTNTGALDNPDELIDALQFWGPVQGKKLIDWGMDPKQIDDPLKDFGCEVWVIGRWVIKAVLNYHPLGEKPYFKASYEEVPGLFWGNSVCDLVRDTQDMCNQAARALANNMSIASGPQVYVMVDRIPSGEEITQIYPWKIWQTTSDPMGAAQKPVEFFQPTSNANELMGIYEKYATIADEVSGIPRYMSGEVSGSIGRTASGMSMLMNNASKAIKQVVANIDRALEGMLRRLYDHNMRYATDPDLKGDVQVVVRGASGVMAKELAAQRRQEFLVSTANPIDMQIIGTEGRAELLREAAKSLDMNIDKIVPSRDVLRARAIQMAGQMQAAAGAPGDQQPPQPGGGQKLMTGEKPVDLHEPKPNP